MPMSSSARCGWHLRQLAEPPRRSQPSRLRARILSSSARLSSASGLSSATRMRRRDGRSRLLTGAHEGAAAAARSRAAACGRRTRCPDRRRRCAATHFAVHLDELAHQRQADAESRLRVGGLRRRENRLNSFDCDSGAMPMPLSLTRNSTKRASRRTLRWMRPPSLVYLAALLSRLPRICTRRVRSPRTISELGRAVDRELVAMLGDHRLQRLDGARDDRLAAHGSCARLDRAARDARDVEQVVDQPRQVQRLAVDDVARPLSCGLSIDAARHDLDGVADRRERIAQLVREDREELVLVPVGSLQRGLGARALGDLGLQQPGSTLASSAFAFCRCRFSASSSRVFSACSVVLACSSCAFASARLAIELLQLQPLAMQLDQHRHLAAQDLRHDRDRDVVDRAELVALEAVELGVVHAGDEDDRRALEARMIVDHRRGLEAVHARHADVEQHQRELVLHQARQRLHARARA